MSALAVAHRAGNSLPALRDALALGVDVVEADVHRHRGRLEVRHLKTAGPLPFLWDRWELAPAAAPRLLLHELLAAADQGVVFMLDLKGRSSAAGTEVARTLHEHARAHRRSSPVLVCGRYWPAVEVFARLPWARTVLSARNRAELLRLRALVRTGRAPYGVSVHRSLLDRAVVAELHERVEVVMTWPVNDDAALDGMLATGVTGIISDEPAVLRGLLGRRPSRPPLG